MLIYNVYCVLSVEVSATSLSFFQRSPTDCGASFCVIKKPRDRGAHSLRWAAEPEKLKIIAFHPFYRPRMPLGRVEV
jgi:hypothetical protein